MTKKLALSISILFFSVFVGTVSPGMTNNAMASEPKKISIGMGNFEPYFIEEGNTGIFADIITAVFNHIPDYEPEYHYGFHMESMWKGYQIGRIDAVANLFDDVDLGGCKSEPAFRFNDVVISKANNSIIIDRIQDLQNYSIVAFQGARVFFDEKYNKAVDATNYIEVGQLELQAKMLHAGRTDVSVGDLYIFLHGLSIIDDPTAIPSNYEVHEVFPQIYSRIGFRVQALCDQFDAGLALIRKSGQYQAIYQKYLAQ